MPRRAISLTPLIDVVFLLLLFFMLASSFERHASMKIATAQGAATTQGAHKPMLVRLRAEGRIDVNGRAAALDQLAGHLRRIDDPLRTRVVVSVGEGVATQALTDVLEQIDRSGATDVTISR